MPVSYEYDVYNMYFDQGKGFAIENVEFKPWKRFWSEYEKTMRSPVSPASGARELLWRTHHVKTGTVKIALPEFDKSPKKARDEMEEALFNYRLLLSFAHEHHVFFESDIVGPRERKGRRFAILYRGGGRNRIWVGKIVPKLGFGRPGLLPFNIRRDSIETFLRHTVTELKKEKIQQRTQVRRGLIWFNMAEHFQSLPFDIRFPSLWTSLETLAWAYARETKTHELQCPVRLDVIQKKFKDLLDEFAVPQSERWKGKITKHALIIDVVTQILDKYHLQQCEKRLRGLYELRNAIVHGKPIDLYSKKNIQNLLMLHRIVELLILRVLKFWKEDLIGRAVVDKHLFPSC